MKDKIETIEDLAHRAYALTQIVRDSCGYNEYFAQEEMLTEVLKTQECIMEKLFEIA